MNWLQSALAIIETVSRTVDRIGPVSFEPIEKHPERAPSAAPSEAQTGDSPSDAEPPARSSDRSSNS